MNQKSGKLAKVADGYWTFHASDESWECYWCGTRWTDQHVNEIISGMHTDEVTVHKAIHKLNPQWKFQPSYTS